MYRYFYVFHVILRRDARKIFFPPASSHTPTPHVVVRHWRRRERFMLDTKMSRALVYGYLAFRFILKLDLISADINLKFKFAGKVRESERHEGGCEIHVFTRRTFRDFILYKTISFKWINLKFKFSEAPVVMIFMYLLEGRVSQARRAASGVNLLAISFFN